MTDPLPALISAGRAASEGATPMPFTTMDMDGATKTTWAGVVRGDGWNSVAKYITAHPPATTRALWDAVEALAAMLADVPQGSWDHMPATVDRASAALARLRAVAEAGR